MKRGALFKVLKLACVFLWWATSAYGFSVTWDETTPSDSEAVSLGASRIRDFKTAIRERLAIDRRFYDDETGKAKVGYANKISFYTQASDPTNEADVGFLYVKDVSSKVELFWEDEDGNTLQLTSGGKAFSFEDLNDVPSYSGNGGKYLRVKSGEDGVEAVSISFTDPLPRNLIIQNNSGAPTSKVDVTADVISVEAVVLTNVSWTIDIQASGADGLDTGSEATSTWYYIWAICNDDGSSEAGLLSTSSSSPTLPTGYTKKRLIGAVYNDSSGDFRNFLQIGKTVYYNSRYTVVSTCSASSWTAVDVSAYVPSVSRVAIFSVYWIYASSSTTLYMGFDGSSTYMTMNGGNDTHRSWNDACFKMPVDSSRQFYYKNNGYYNSNSKIYLNGFELNIL